MANPTSAASGGPVHAAYRLVDGFWLIELKVREVRDLFDTLDPAPFQTKDLNAAAEEYIVDAVRELGLRRAIKLCVYLPEHELQLAQSRGVSDAIRNFFAYRTKRSALELRRMLIRGVTSVAIALAFLFVCLSLRQMLSGASATATVLQEGLLIMGWVAMWRPIDIFLYDWWPIWRHKRIHSRIARLPIELSRRPE